MSAGMNTGISVGCEPKQVKYKGLAKILHRLLLSCPLFNFNQTVTVNWVIESVVHCLISAKRSQ